MTPARLAALGIVLLGAAAAALPGAPRLAFPLACEIGKTCEIQNYVDDDPGPGVRDYRCGGQTYNGHSGVDIRLLDMAAQRRGVDVLAAAPGRVARLRDGVADISIRAPGAPSVANQECGNAVVIDNGGGWETQYCHLARGSVKVKVGDQVRTGQPLARVGLSGSTEFPHLHLTVRQGSTNIDPFAPGRPPGANCAAGATLWTPEAAKAMTYKTGAVLNAGFAAESVTMDSIEAGGLAGPSATSPMLVAYVRAIGLRKGDVVDFRIFGPDGAVLVSRRDAPLPRDQAQIYLMIGKKRPPTGGWPKGGYTATYQVLRDGRAAISRTFKASL